MTGALDGPWVIELTQVMAGPFCGHGARRRARAGRSGFRSNVQRFLEK
jgi:hypothetical protein